MYSRLIEIVNSFSRQPILLVGDLILDRYVYGDADRISPEAPVPVLRKRHDEDRVGGAGSVAANLAELGMEVICCGAVGLDDAGHRVRALLESQGVSTRGVLSLADRPTTTKTRFVGLAQHRHRQQLIRVDEEVTRPLSETDADRCIEMVIRALKKVSVVCLEDYDKGLLSEQMCRRIIDAATAAGKEVLVDPARLRDCGKYRGATILTPNRSEFQLISGCPDTTVESIAAHVEVALERCGVSAILVTLDREGCLLGIRGRTPQLIPTRPRSVYDNTGAGDAVLAMLAAARACGADWEEAARLTNVAGGLEVEKFGCVPITRDEVLAELRLAGAPGETKIRSLNDLAAELSLRKSRGQTVVFTNGCYDIVHAGHVRFLNQCRALGNVVVVGVNSDASVRQQGKGSDRPIVPQDQRAEVIAALQSVDYVVIFDEPTPAKVIERLSPDVLVKGEDWTHKGVVGREHVEANGGRVVLLPLLEGVSTTAIVNRIRGTR
ncbi:MAG TPA: D-glycero-beta-D-manno-heptose 1-phosphate adenylyltransferase [Phycisphaerae bacterium]|nr:D-glycero-beta-D-manno-heptose 1-phosphate adenylyltransferase [Phycisphaerae bacterium]HOJ75139.1 D-glycero-beta-D-manno-heptose 1-phosphate adenylyltransferase [Phycisphaerae bacterium]HOM52369.1 D-glycero-beta-D-manno-heptose 1-phosphate adenylyltransferase [Phycisphaerae bacterium]HON64948.1 D-glycero-beta-D-manno-heptose 1-phosphate adenylyltransferase [Phycisphaerae bacterium]HOQ85155.1 D-glycero-beta-D-manno-heptose 1-phosphate adenylyltransferase [Phycisphaerae bacterium]